MYLTNGAMDIIERKLKQGKRIEMEYNHQKDELKILEHKITRIKLNNKEIEKWFMFVNWIEKTKTE